MGCKPSSGRPEKDVRFAPDAQERAERRQRGEGRWLSRASSLLRCVPGDLDAAGLAAISIAGEPLLQRPTLNRSRASPRRRCGPDGVGASWLAISRGTWRELGANTAAGGYAIWWRRHRHRGPARSYERPARSVGAGWPAIRSPVTPPSQAMPSHKARARPTSTRTLSSTRPIGPATLARDTVMILSI